MANPGILLGFVGTGASSPENTHALLSDFVDAYGVGLFVVPVVPTFWNANLAAVLDFANDNHIPYEALITAETAGAKGLKPYVDKAKTKTKVINTGVSLINALAGNAAARLIILWDEEPQTREIIRAALDKQIIMLDLTQGLGEITFTDVPPTDGQQGDTGTMPTDAQLTWEYLKGLSDEDLQALAESFDIDHANIPTWDEVRDLIFEQKGVYSTEYLASLDDDAIQAIAEANDIDHAAYGTWDEVRDLIVEMAGGGSGPAPDGEEVLPTAEEVDAMEFEELKKFAADHGIAVAPRTRTPGYQDAIKAWLGGDTAGAEAQAEGEPLDTSGLDEKLDLVLQGIGTLGIAVDRLTTTLDQGLQDLATMLSSAEPAAAATGASKAVGVTKTAAPAAKATGATKAGSVAKAGGAVKKAAGKA